MDESKYLWYKRCKDNPINDLSHKHPEWLDFKP